MKPIQRYGTASAMLFFFVALVGAGAQVAPAKTTAWRDGRFHIDTGGVISRSDIVLGRANMQAKEAMPLGNGSLGVSVWSGEGFTAQLNRADTLPDRYSGGVCTYTGTGFVTNPSCQPNGYNVRAFPQRVDGLRQQATDTLQASFQRHFQITERFNLEARCEAYNVLNRQSFAAPITSPTSSNFGQVVSDGPGKSRWITIQGRLRF